MERNKDYIISCLLSYILSLYLLLKATKTFFLTIWEFWRRRSTLKGGKLTIGKFSWAIQKMQRYTFKLKFGQIIICQKGYFLPLTNIPFSCKISFQKLAYALGFLPKDLILIGIFPSQKTGNKKFQETGDSS